MPARCLSRFDCQVKQEEILGAGALPDHRNDQGTGRGRWPVASVRQRLAPMHMQMSRAGAVRGTRWRVKAVLRFPGVEPKLALCFVNICNGNGFFCSLFTPILCLLNKAVARIRYRFDYIFRRSCSMPTSSMITIAVASDIH